LQNQNLSSSLDIHRRRRKPNNKPKWKIIKAFIQDTPEPPPYTSLSDVQIFNIMTQDITQDNKYKNQPLDFQFEGYDSS
jgi:hypothetical protein